MATHTHIILIPLRKTFLAPPQQSHLQPRLRRIFLEPLPEHFTDYPPRQILLAQLLNVGILLFGLGVFSAATRCPWTLMYLSFGLSASLSFLLEMLQALWIWEDVYWRVSGWGMSVRAPWPFGRGW